MQDLRQIIARNRAGSGEALPSVCSAHPLVITAALILAEERNEPCLIEATSNQVNQFGGYTGMTPPDFMAYVYGLCDRHAISRDRVLFGGDHLGPQVWREQPAAIAMAHARTLVEAYVGAGFTKIHLDCSEGCAGEAAQIGDRISAQRAADLAEVCERATATPDALSYIFGTEVPPPGGARADEGELQCVPTSPASARATIAAHKSAFAERGLEGAWLRAVGLVVQPGLEFAPDHVIHFDCHSPDLLSPLLADTPGLCFEAHSTDYQQPDVYQQLARRHFAILKVGPALTFACRQALFALDAVLAMLAPAADRTPLPTLMDTLMVAEPAHWCKHYTGTAEDLRLLRFFGYADRIRYYWNTPVARAAVAEMLGALRLHRPLRPLLEQYFAVPVLERAQALQGQKIDWAEALILSQIQEALLPYLFSGKDKAP